MHIALRILIHFLIFVLLTALTQIGGILWILTVLSFKRSQQSYRRKRLVSFILLYLIVTFLIVPLLAPLSGREKIQNTDVVVNHSFLTLILNRNYVTPQLQQTLQRSGSKFQKRYPELKIVYLDACFPFFKGFPLLPHLSHNDGRKIDISFIYSTKNGELTNKKPSVSGYGVFAGPKANEFSQRKLCKQKGYLQYDFTKYLSFGVPNKNLDFNANATAFLVNLLARDIHTRKIFIEPHLKTRLKLLNSKIRYQGCQAVRHDDHIHLQL